MSFNEKLQHLRKENKLSQEQLADMLDVTRQSVSKWESGTTYPEMDKLITMCKIFKCSLDDLTNDEITEINVEKKETNGNLIGNLVSSVLNIIDKTVKMFRSMNAKQIAGVIVTMFILGCFLFIIRVPFEVLENGFYMVVSNIPNRRIAGSLSGLFNMLFDIVFFVLYILAFVYIYKVAYLDKYEFTEKENPSKESVSDDKEIIREEQPREVKVVRPQNPIDNTIFAFLGNIVIWFFRILCAICIVPFVITLVVLFAAVVIAIVLLTEGIVYIGILLGILFAIILNLWLLEIGCVFIFNKKSSFHRLLCTFFIGIAGIGISFGLIALEIGNTTYIDEVPAEFELETVTEEYTMTDDLTIDGTSYYYRSMDYVADETLQDKIIVTVGHYTDINNPVLKKNDNILSVGIYYASSLMSDKKIWDILKRDLAQKELHNYSELHRVNVTIKSSQENLDKLQKNSKDYLNELHKREYDDYTYEFEVRISDYENQIESLTEENEQLKEKILELEEYKTRIQDILE